MHVSLFRNGFVLQALCFEPGDLFVTFCLGTEAYAFIPPFILYKFGRSSLFGMAFVIACLFFWGGEKPL